MNTSRTRLLAGCLACLAPIAAVSCGSDDGDGAPAAITLVAYDSFQGEALDAALAEFTADTGIAVTVARAGDTGTMVTKAVLTAGNPEGDVIWGIDNTMLSAAVDGDVFEAYRPAGADAIDPRLAGIAEDGLATPVDFGDVCVNTDLQWFADEGLEPPATLGDLADPAYRGLLVVENPATSSPGLAFLLATIAEFGEDGWQDYWRELRANDVEVADSWDIAYGERFSGVAGGGGDRPLVVSYGSSPPAEVIFADPPVTEAPTGVVAATCFRQVEFAGVLRGTEHPDEARRLMDFLVSERFQQELPLTLFVYPARSDVTLPEAFTEFAVVPEETPTVSPQDIADHRAEWQDEWTQIVLR